MMKIIHQWHVCYLLSVFDMSNKVSKGLQVFNI